MDTPLDIALRAELDKRRGDWPQIAKVADVSHSWVSQFVRGKIPNPGYATLLRIQGALAPQGAPAVPTALTGRQDAAAAIAVPTPATEPAKAEG